MHQTYVNWRLKSTKALSVYSVILTIICEIAYGIHVFGGDIATAFKVSAIVANFNEILLLIQIWYYNGRNPYWFIAMVGSISTGVGLIAYFSYNPSSLIIHLTGIVVVGVNMIRLFPQIVLNWQRKSTHGYSIVRLLVLMFNSSLLLISSLMIKSSIHIVLNNIFKLSLRSIMLLQHMVYNNGSLRLVPTKRK